jgi:hypothetical protein
MRGTRNPAGPTLDVLLMQVQTNTIKESTRHQLSSQSPSTTRNNNQNGSSNCRQQNFLGRYMEIEEDTGMSFITCNWHWSSSNRPIHM